MIQMHLFLADHSLHAWSELCYGFCMSVCNSGVL